MKSEKVLFCFVLFVPCAQCAVRSAHSRDESSCVEGEKREFVSEFGSFVGGPREKRREIIFPNSGKVSKIRNIISEIISIL